MFPEQQRITQQINHLMDVMVKSECEIRPHFFLTGPTGSRSTPSPTHWTNQR